PLVPLTPLALWIHPSPIPDRVGFAALPGALAAAAALWGALLPGTAMRPALAAVAAVGTAGAGLGLTHPNVAVTALILLAVLTAVTSAPRWGRRPAPIAGPGRAPRPGAPAPASPSPTARCRRRSCWPCGRRCRPPRDGGAARP